MKLKLIISIIAVTFFSGIIHNIIHVHKYTDENRYINKEFYCKDENKTFQIQLLDLKKSEIELDKKLFKSYSIPYVRFDGECYEDICLDLIKTKIPNKDISEFRDLYKYKDEINGTIEEKEINRIREIPMSNVINT